MSNSSCAFEQKAILSQKHAEFIFLKYWFDWAKSDYVRINNDVGGLHSDFFGAESIPETEENMSEYWEFFGH